MKYAPREMPTIRARRARDCWVLETPEGQRLRVASRAWIEDYARRIGAAVDFGDKTIKVKP